MATAAKADTAALHQLAVEPSARRQRFRLADDRGDGQAGLRMVSRGLESAATELNPWDSHPG